MRKNRSSANLCISAALRELHLHYELEFRFAKPRLWRFDWFVPAHNLAVELEGGIWIYGRHTRGAGFQRDMEKYNMASVLGFSVLRFSTRDALDGTAKKTIRSWIAHRGGEK